MIISNRLALKHFKSYLGELVKRGVSQGTSLSPLLFNVQINDINALSLFGKLVCYANDTVLIFDSWNEVFQKIQ